MARDFGPAQVWVTAVLSLAGCTAQAQQAYDASDWVKFGCSTYPLNTSSTPLGSGVQNPNVVYDPSKLWATGDNGRYATSHPNAWNPMPNGVFDGYDFARATYTDSAAAATAIATGQKTFNNAINWSDLNASISPTIVEFAHNQGKATGTISSVQWSHATPAGLSNAHNVSRNNYAAIALQMVYGAGGTPAQPGTPVLDVIIGCGNPDYNNDGASAPGFGDLKYVGGAAAWADMGSGAGGTTSSGYNVVHTKAAFETLASGDPAGRYLGIPQVYTTLQQARGGATKVAPYTVPFNPNVPTLETMTQAALNILDGTQANPNADGFFLHVEGGAVDWANHANDLGRMIEEKIDFNHSVQAVSDYLDAGTNGNNWSNTLVILTADHETGFLLGPDAATVPYDGLVNTGQGNLPLHAYISGSHTNSLVPLYARGPGSELFATLVDGTDSQMVGRYGLWQDFDGRYVDNTDIFTVMAEALDGDGTSDAKNVILMIADGAGFNTWTAATMYEHGVPGPVLIGSEPAADGTLPKTQNNVLFLTFDSAIAPPGGPALSIINLHDSTDVSGSFAYTVEPDGLTLKATESGAVLTNLTWYRVTPGAGLGVQAFVLDVCTLQGDADGTGQVLAQDYFPVKNHLFELTEARNDLDGNAQVLAQDYFVVKNHLFNVTPAKP